MCPYGTYISTACESTTNQNTVCSACSKCNNLQYVSRECVYGLDTICGSCETCTFERYFLVC